MKRFLTIVVLLWIPGAALAQTDAPQPESADEFELPGAFNSTIALATDYVFRGVSQSDEDVAVQASLDWSHESGVYTGFWSSNVDFKDGSSQIELDVYGGYASAYKDITYDVMVLGYVYPGASGDLNLDFVEFSLALGHDLEVASIGTAVAISPDFRGSSGVGAHVSGGVGIPIPFDVFERYRLAIDSNVGYQDISNGGSYVHWDVGIAGEWLGFVLDLRYVGNDIDSRADTDDDRAVFTFSRSF